MKVIIDFCYSNTHTNKQNGLMAKKNVDFDGGKHAKPSSFLWRVFYFEKSSPLSDRIKGDGVFQAARKIYTHWNHCYVIYWHLERIKWRVSEMADQIEHKKWVEEKPLQV